MMQRPTSLTRRLTALALSWVLPATTVWASSPRPDVRPRTPAADRSNARAKSAGTAPGIGVAQTPRYAAAAAQSTSTSGSATFFGPQKYIRTTGPKNVYTATIDVPASVPGPFTLRVQNGEADGSHRISSAWIEVGGLQVAEPSDFNQNVAVFDRPVTLSAHTSLKVTLASQPGSYLYLSCLGQSGDVTAPIASWTEPAPGSVSGNRTPRLRVTYSDPAGPAGGAPSGIDTTTLVVLLDGVDRTSFFTRTPTEATAQLGSGSALSDGTHTLTARIKDTAGNQGQSTATFTVDLTPPQLAWAEPASGSLSNNKTPRLRATYTDGPGPGGAAPSAIDPATLLVLLDGVDRTSLFAAGSAEASVTLPTSLALADGSHSLSAQIKDRAGNPATAAASFTVDATAPSVVVTAPSAGDTSGATTLTVAGGVTDASPVTVKVNGIDAAVTGASFTALGVPVGPGPNATFTAVATDAAGNAGSAAVTVHVDRTAPTVQITSPAEGATVRGPEVEVRGTFADSSTVTIEVNGTTTTNTGNNFTGHVTVPDGPLTLTALARDAGGNVSNSAVHVIVDSAAPVIVIAEPAEGANTNATSVSVRGQITDASTVTATVNGQALAVAAGGTFDGSAPLGAEGTATLTVVATDLVGNIASADRHVVVDRTPPTLTVASPVAGARIAAFPVVVQGLAQDATAVSVTVDGAPAIRTGDAWQWSVGTLPNGPHVFAVVARDPAGNETTRTVSVIVGEAQDLPVVRIASPATGLLTRDSTVAVTGTVEAQGLAGVTVNGVAAAVQGSGPFTFSLAALALAEGDNTIAAVATSGGGQTGGDVVLVTRDSTPPFVDLTTEERIARGQSAAVVATATDAAVGVATVAFRVFVNGRESCAGAAPTLAAPPYAFDLSVPACAATGETLTVVAEATDRAGNKASVARGVRIGADGAALGQVLSDATGLPLAGATVAASRAAVTASATTDARGRFTFALGDGPTLLRATKAGSTAVERPVVVAPTVGTVAVDLRLTPRAAAATLDASGSVMAAPTTAPLPFGVTVTVPAGAVAAPTSATLTRISPQGLPGLLPLGWSPLAAFELASAGPIGGSLPVDIMVPTPPAVAHLVRYDESLHAWTAVASGLLPVDDKFAANLPGAGHYALVVSDGGDPPLAVPVPGELLQGLAMVAVPATATSRSRVTPTVIPPTGGTAEGALTVSSPAPLPSGTVVSADITETYTLATGAVASEEKRLVDIVLYRAGTAVVPAEAGTSLAGSIELSARFPITPTRTFEAIDLTTGTVHLDILAGREGVRGATGGSEAIQLRSGDAALAIPALALTAPTPIDFRQVEVETSLPTAPGLTAMAEVSLDLAGATLAIGAQLALSGAAIASIGPEDGLLFARIDRFDGVPKPVVVALAELQGDRVVSTPLLGLPGITREGRYVLYRSTNRFGFVSGATTAQGAGGVVAVQAQVTSAGLPFVAVSDSTGHYLVVSLPGPVVVSAMVPGTSLAGAGPATVIAGQTAALDLTLAGTLTTATVTPPDGSLGVEATVQFDLAATSPLRADSVTTDAVKLYKGDPAAGVAVAVRFVLSTTKRLLSVVPVQPLEYSKSYTLVASGLVDGFGGPVAVPTTRITTRDFVPPVYDPTKLAFGYPDVNGFVTLTAPAGSFAPGSEVLILNTGNGDVATFQIDNQGGLGILVPATIRASISDRLLVTITDPLGNVITFTRSEFVAPDGRTGIGMGGGVVRGAGGVELRVPEGALDQGVTMRLESLTAAQLEGLYPGQQPSFGNDASGRPRAHLASGLRITSADKPRFSKEAHLAFPIPDFSAVPADQRPPRPEDAVYYVVRRIEVPSGQYVFQTLAHASLQGDGPARRVVTESPPFSGYTDSLGVITSAAGVVGFEGLSQSNTILFWTYDSLLPGQPGAGVVTGKALRAVWDPKAASPTYVPVAGAWIAGVDAAGQPAVGGGIFGAFSQADGTFTLWDPLFVGGTVRIAARAEGAPADAACGTNEGRFFQCATAFEVAPESYHPGLAIRYRSNVATTNVSFPAIEPPLPAPEIQIRLMTETAGVRKVVTNGLVIQGTTLVVGVSTTEGVTITAVDVQGRAWGVRSDPRAGQPLGMPFILDPAIDPQTLGLYTVVVTALPAFGAPVRATLNFRVIASGGTGDDNLPNDPPAVLGDQTLPADRSNGVTTAIFPRVVFSEPVRRIVSAGRPNVKLEEITASGAMPVPASLSGVGRDVHGTPVAYDNISDEVTTVTSVTIEPRGGLKYGARYAVVVLGDDLEPSDGIIDVDRDPAGNPTPKALATTYRSEFQTYAPGSLNPAGTGETFLSPGIVVLGERAWLVQNDYYSGTLRAFDVKDPVFPREVVLGGYPYVTGRPIDIAGEEATLVVPTGAAGHSRPENLSVFDVSSPTDALWVGAASLTSSTVEGSIMRVRVRNDRAYASTFRKGIQVVDLGRARDNFFAAISGELFTPGYFSTLQKLNTDGQGFGHDAVVSTTKVETAPGLPARLYDLDIADLSVDGLSQPVVVATGDIGLATVNPQTQRLLFPTPVALGHLDSAGNRLDQGQAVALGEVVGGPIAVVAGFGRINGTPKPLLVVVGVSRPQTPEPLGWVELPEAPTDVLLRDGIAIVATSRAVYLVSVLDPRNPAVISTAIQGVGGTLAAGAASDLIFSTAYGIFGGSDPLGGVRAASLKPPTGGGDDACPLLSLNTPKVSLSAVQDPLNGTLCGDEGTVVFGLCRAAKVDFTIDGRAESLSIDGAPAAPIASLPLGPGVHTVTVPYGVLGGPVLARKPFEVHAQDLADPAIVQNATGEIEGDLKNRSVLPVGHTFVKGVDVFDGHVVRQSTDLKVPGRHLGLEVTRSYSSAAKGAEGLMGAGWSFNYESQLTPTACGVWVVQTADGSSQSFRTTDGGLTFTAQKGYHTKLARNGDGWDFIDKSGTRHRFREPLSPRDPTGSKRLEYIEEPHGDRIVPRYDADGHVIAVSEVQAPNATPVRTVSFTYTSAGGHERVASATMAPLALRVEYRYDLHGNLVEAKRVGTNLAGQPRAEDRVETYEYSANDVRDRYQLTAAIDPNGNRTEISYYLIGDPFPGETASGRPGLLIVGKEEYVKEVREFPAVGQTLKTAFSFDYQEALAGRFKNTVIDPRGKPTLYVLNANGSPLEIQEPLGKTTRMAWATDDVLKLQETDANGRVTDYGYDPRGNLTSERIQTTDLGVIETQYAYDAAFNKLTTKTDAEARVTRYEIDAATGDLKSTTDALGNVTRYAYDTLGRLTSTTDPRGNATTHSDHDSFGNPEKTTDALGNLSQQDYDARARLVRETDIWGRDHQVTYDGMDRPVLDRRVAGGPTSPEISDDETTETEYFVGGETRVVRNAKGARTEITLDGLNRPVATQTRFGSTILTTATEYDGNGNKTHETDRRGVVKKSTYDDLNRLTKVEVEAGLGSEGPLGRIAAFEYDLVGNKTAETDLAGLRTGFVLDGLYRVKEKVLPESPTAGVSYREQYGYDKVGNRLTVTDANGHSTQYAYDKLSRLIRTTNALGQVATATYDDPEGSHVNKSEDRDLTRGLRTTYRYDKRNREQTRTVKLEGAGAAGETYVTSTTYDDRAHSMTTTDPRGNAVRTALDGLDRITSQVVDPGRLGLETVSVYDGLGNKKALQDPSGHVSRFEYDALGRLVRTVDALGKETLAAYDGEGLKTRQTDRRGIAHDLTYDNLGRPRTEAVDGTLAGVPWSRETVYGDVARKRTEKDAKNQATVHELDGLNRVTKTTDPAGKSVVMTYDGVNKVSERDKRGNTTRFAYDDLNRLAKTTDPTPFETQTVEVTYDDARNRKIEKDRRGTKTVTQTDPLGRVVTVTDAATVNASTGAVTGIVLETHVYDGNGNKTSTKDAEGKETRFAYDAANRVASRADGFGTPEAATTTYAYDKNGNPTEEKDQRAADLGEPFSAQKAYDDLNRLRTVKDGEGEVTTYAYDDEGNKTQVKDAKDQPADYAYDELGKLIRVTQASPAPGDPRPATSYTYDKNRNRIRQTDANLHVVEMQYDSLNRLTVFTQDPGGFGYVTRHDYDENGNETKLTDPKGQTVVSAYDELNRQKTKTYTFAPGDPVRPWRHTTAVAYTYDPSSNLTQVDESVASGTDPPETKTTTRTYDDLDRLASESTPLPDGGTRTVVYTYFGNGTRKTLTDAEGLVTQYTYDGQNRTKTATTAFGRPEAATTTYTYWPDDLLKSVQTPNGVVAAHSYDKADRLTALANAKGGAAVSRYAYTYDPNGNRLSQVEENGGLTETTTYTYDGLDRLASVTYPTDANYLNGRVVSYGYDAVGNRARETERSTAGAILADKQGVFDNLNRLTSLADLVTSANSTTFTWDQNGNQLTKTVGAGLPTEYRYDIRDKLVETVQGPSTLGRFQYDFQGRRNQKIGQDGVKQYVYDQTSVLAEYDEAGVQKAKYDYGSDRLVSLFRTDEGRRYFHLDGLRSVVNLTDDAGSVAASYHLTAFGEYRFPTELAPSKNRFGFTGYEWDPETGLYNAKARYFDPQLGRFLTQDSYLGQIDNPPSLHRYFYANDNPTRYTDPTGHCSDCPKDPITAFREDVEATGRGFVQGAAEATRDAAVGTLTTTTRLVSTMTPPHQRVPIEMQEAVPALRPFGREDVAQLKKDVKFTVDTLRNIRQTGPAALDAMAELAPEDSGRVLGSTTVNTIATVEGGRGLVTGGIRALRALPGEAGEVGGNLAGMFKGRSGPGSAVLVEPGSTKPLSLPDTPPSMQFDPPLEGSDRSSAFSRRNATRGFQEHHIISDKNPLTRQHELLDLSGFDLQSRPNKIFLPKDAEIHPTRSIHRGRHRTGVSERMAKQMDQVVEIGTGEGWSQAQYQQALRQILQQERQALREGTRALNKNQRPGAQ